MYKDFAYSSLEMCFMCQSATVTKAVMKGLSFTLTIFMSTVSQLVCMLKASIFSIFGSTHVFHTSVELI